MGKEQDRAITKPAEDSCLHSPTRTHVHALWYFGSFVSCPETQTWRCSLHVSRPTALPVCVECLFSRSPSRAPYRTPPACAKRAAYPDPPPVVPHSESIAAQAAYCCVLTLVMPGPVCVCVRVCARSMSAPLRRVSAVVRCCADVAPLRRVRCRVVRCCAAALVSHIRGYGSSTGTHQTTMTTWYDLGKSPRRFPFIIMTYYNQHQSP